MKFLTLTLAAVLTLAFSLPAEAGLTWTEKGIFKSQMLVGKLANCLAKADANVTKGKRVDTAADDGKCIDRYITAWGKNRDKALEKGADEGEDMSACEAATTDAMRDGALVATLLAADRVLGTFGLDGSDLLADGAIQEAVDAAVADVDITSDNQSVCEAAGGTWADDACTAGSTPSSYNCDIGAMCSYWAQAYPGDLPLYTNNYVGDEPGVGPAAACQTNTWTDRGALANWFDQSSFNSPYWHYAFDGLCVSN